MNSFAGQDSWVLQTLNNKTNGIFVDLGSGDGVKFNNTFALEKDYDWMGVCVESNQSKYNDLVNNRTSVNRNIVIYNYKGQCVIDENGRITTGSGTTVDCDTFENIMIDSGVPNQIDYLSINIAGNELDVLRTIDFNNYEIKLITVDHDYYFSNMYYKWEIFYFLSDNGFTRVVSDAHCLEQYADEYGRQPFEDWYVNNLYL